MANTDKNQTVSASSVAAAVKQEATTEKEITPAEVTPVAEPEAAPVVEEKKAEPAVTPTPAPSSMRAPVTPSISTEGLLVQLNARITQYKQVNTGILTSDTQRKQAIHLFQNIIDYVIKNPTQDNLDRLFKFFKEDARLVLAPTSALQGIQNMELSKRNKIEVVYTMFFEMTRPKPSLLDFRQASKVLGSNDKIVAYVTEKIKKLQAAAK